ncbi:hypothetical protein [Nostoc sp. UIC 10630]|uniref:hypothetical protein n=1 Tax=Nostoc sp. UIC 10630 TaxID=2100146 RepID=UPI0013D19FBA|nr:hypothetical protein [Nostoc sp. UIC 10630]NEU83792.1 hypothetical protein [Nostoc sp. UIC 10630]
MLSKRYPIVLFLSVVFIALTGRTSVAYNISPAEPEDVEFYRELSVAPIPGRPNEESITYIDKDLWFQPLPRGGTSMFNAGLIRWGLQRAEGGLFSWKFEKAENDLKGNFKIRTYQACNLRDACGGVGTSIGDRVSETIEGRNYRGVGALFHIEYEPNPTDPQPGQGKLHWIQVLRASYQPPNFPNPFLPVVDRWARDTPYYDFPNSRYAGETFLIDKPYANGWDRAMTNNYFSAHLYLVQETTPPDSRQRTVTVYNGIQWGWKNEVRRVCPPEIQDCTPPPPPPTCDASSGGGGCNADSTYGLFDNNSVDQEMSYFDIADTSWTEDEELWDYNWDNYINNSSWLTKDDSESPVSTPEFTSSLGLLALGAWGIIKALSIRFEK